MSQSMLESPCLDIERLRVAFAEGCLADTTEALGALDHFASPCPSCWQNLESAMMYGWEINLVALERHASKALHEPPVALALGRLVSTLHQPKTARVLPPTQRHLLFKPTWRHGFKFWWLLIEEARSLSLGSSAPQLKRWQTMANALLRPSDRTERHCLELELLIRAYQADETRIEGRSQAADTLLTKIQAQAGPCRPAIRATIYEMQADLARISWSNPERALEDLDQATELLKDVLIPGRRAETLFRIALTHRCEAKLEPAFASFAEALSAMPQGTDPRLRNEILLHMAAIQMRMADFCMVRHYLKETEPLFKSHASELMQAQGQCLWGFVYLAEDDFDRAKEQLVSALQAFYKVGVPPGDALASLAQFSTATPKETRVDQVLTEIAVALRQPGIHLHLADAVERVLNDARHRKLESPVTI